MRLGTAHGHGWLLLGERRTGLEATVEGEGEGHTGLVDCGKVCLVERNHKNKAMQETVVKGWVVSSGSILGRSIYGILKGLNGEMCLGCC